jgi:hypothetical protein
MHEHHPPIDLTWLDFRSRHESNPMLAFDPLYTLTVPVIEAVKKALPGFFSPENERF